MAGKYLVQKGVALKKLIALAMSAFVLVPVLAIARHLTIRDPNDTKGRLDIRVVDVAGSQRKPRWIIESYSKWTLKQIFDTGFFVVQLDTIGNQREDYYALVRSDGRRLHASLYKDRKHKRDRRVTGLSVSRPNGRSVAVTVPLSKTSRRRGRIFYWYAQTLFTSDNCRSVCIDRAPDRGRVAEPGPEPSPTDTLPTP